MSAKDKIDKITDVPDALPAGHRFNEFEIEEVIGGGGFGIVYRAWDHLLERTIAIKEYFPVSLATRHDRQNIVLRGERHQKLFNAGLNSFIHEARLLARFNHPGLLHVLRFWEENGTAYMGTLYYSGITLKKWHQNNPHRLNDTWIRQLLPPLFGAIDTIHQAGYLHRDISLDNIQIQDNHLPILLDFGSARKEIGNLSDETEVMLKPGYAPIEQYNEDSNADQGPWTDIYALGAVLHALIMGSPPPVSVVRCIEDRYQPLTTLRPEGFSLPLLNAIDRSLAMKPQDRPQSIDELAALIELPVRTVEELVAKAAPSREKAATTAPLHHEEVISVNARTAENTAESVTSSPVFAMQKPLIIAGGVIACLIAATVSVISWIDQTADDAGNSPSPARVSEQTPDSVQEIAKVYLKMNHDERLSVDGRTHAVTPDSNGFASLSLPAGSHQIEVASATATRRQQLEVTHAGTWLIDPR
ncbi:serine/threonine protein kinase [Erwinia tracheiphila]|uniref:Serine/threonine protein kinase n=1 Tax=Erwinia tracheiphila TaxID=65700 RepID=A0A345CRE2_9GAMM|nr:serine/threonine-protein kinase [Erwinia tracheiphila]AXF76009.1 serine/threonine protein kinase [Erwinia tracheiphila]UIA85331.1 serine/threonine protein kinase [Erwinia tracheiphila]UIA93855.1 serine/threonine protein kinase [Erwinia tracheiphila]